ncbi:MAG: DUF4279 domain-containing protein [Leptospira sp.]|jgi:hypothetical protein|nr:DUF4279 domain-containing protein [Leptospira sp.]
METGTQREAKSWAMFAISGARLRPSEITEKLGIKPDYYHGSDTKDMENRPLPGHWQLNSKLGPEAKLNDHIWELLKTLGPVRKTLRDLTDGLEVSIYASVEYASEFSRGIQLDKRTMLLLGEMGVSLEITPWLSQTNFAESPRLTK